MMRRTLLLLAFAGLALAAHAQRVDLIWPSPNHAFDEGKSIAAFLQQAGSGDPASGGFGGVRTNGRQFHEGIDIQPVKRDRRGEPADPVYAAMDGVVRHVSSVAGNSSYGRYIVLEHPGVKPAIYTLYAHLAHIAPQIRPGATVRRGQTLGIMGRSAAGYAIPRDRAHLHFEMGLRLSDDFQAWYNWKRFGSPNEHGVYNGFNLMGFDPLDFFREYRAHRVDNFQQYLGRMPVVVKARVATKQVPDFVRRYPSLVTKHLPMLIAGWEVSFAWTGLPIRWTPLDADEVKGMRRNEVRITYVDEATERREKSKDLVVSRRGGWQPGEDLQTVLQLLFDIR